MYYVTVALCTSHLTHLTYPLPPHTQIAQGKLGVFTFFSLDLHSPVLNQGVQLFSQLHYTMQGLTLLTDRFAENMEVKQMKKKV